MKRSPSDPGLEAELEEIARRLRAELRAQASPPHHRPARDRRQAAAMRFVAATVLPGLLLIGLILGMNG